MEHKFYYKKILWSKTGVALLYRGFFTEKQMDDFFIEMENKCKFAELPLKMFNKEIIAKRLNCSEGDYGSAMKYGRNLSGNEDWTSAVKEIKDAMELICCHPLNHAYINLYRDGDDLIGKHGDKLGSLVKNPSEVYKGASKKPFICSISLGATRIFSIQPKLNRVKKGFVKNRETIDISLVHGDILLMDYKMQDNYYHSIKRVTKKEPLIPIRIKGYEEKSERSACEGLSKEYTKKRINITYRLTILDK